MVFETIATLIAGVVFGLALAAPPGPMNAIIAEESVVRGWTAGFLAGLGAMTADLLFFLLALAGTVTVVERRPTLRAAMVGIGGLLMLYFAVGAVRDARSTMTAEASTGTATGFRKAFVLALTNPYQILFWLTVGIGLVQPGRHDVLANAPLVGDPLAGTVTVETGGAALVGGLFAGILVWIVGFPAGLVRARERVDAVGPIVAVVSAVLLAGFGLAFLLDAATTLGS